MCCTISRREHNIGKMWKVVVLIAVVSLSVSHGRIAVDVLKKDPGLLDKFRTGTGDAGHEAELPTGQCSPKYFYAVKDENGTYTKCSYYKCINGKKTELRCAAGTRISSFYLNKKGFGSTYGKMHPCSVPSSECRSSYAEKGVIDRNVTACGVDLLFIVDVSCSISDADKRSVKDFIIGVIRTMDISQVDTNVALLAYHSQVMTILDFNDGAAKSRRKAIVKIRNKLPVTNPTPLSLCGTATDEAIKLAREVIYNRKLPESKQPDADDIDVRSISGERQTRADVTFVITDGATHPKENTPITIVEAKKLQTHGVTVHLITLPNDSDNAKDQVFKDRMESEFQAIPTSQTFRHDMGSFEQLKVLMKDMKTLSCQQL